MRTTSLLGVIVLCAAFLPAQDQTSNPTTNPQQAPIPAVQPTTPRQPQAAATPAPEVARVHVYRARRYAGSALSPTIAVDGKQVARVGNGRRVTIRLTPGPHTIASDDKSSSVSIDAKAGQDYYIRVDEETGFWKGHGKLTMLLPEQGSAEYKLQKPIESDRRVAADMIEDDSGDPPPPTKK